MTTSVVYTNKGIKFSVFVMLSSAIDVIRYKVIVMGKKF